MAETEGRETAESAAFRKLSYKVAECLEHQESPARVARHLYSLGLIGECPRNNVSYADSPEKKVEILLRAMENSIRNNPDNFDKIVNHLATKEVFKEIVAELRNAREEARLDTGTLFVICECCLHHRLVIYRTCRYGTSYNIYCS